MHVAIRVARLLVPIACAAWSVACGVFDESPVVPAPTPSGENLLADGGFEGGATAWTAFPPAGAHEVTSSAAHGGASSMALRLSPSVSQLAVTQVLNPSTFPEFVSGFYRVDQWPEEGAFLQFVVSARGAAPDETREVRFVIAGVSTAPDEENSPLVRYVFLSRDDPVVGEWTYFAYPVRYAFQVTTGRVPEAWTSIDVSVEARSLTGAIESTAYFDDLYAGPQAGNPNRPKQTRH
jgi:hypothetical protein